MGIHFCRLRSPHPEPHLTLNNQAICFNSSIKLLGITFDKKLYWKQQIDDLITRCRKGLNLIKSMASVRWGIA
nr:unnamed protein product [Callosobruchus analis]